MLRDESDEALLGRYRGGETRAFEVLLLRHQKGIYNFLRRHVGDDSLAEDLLQEVFLRVIRASATFQGGSKLSTWIYAIARNLAIDALRRAKHRRTESLDGPVGHGDDDARPRELADPAADVEREAGARDLGKRLEAAIAGLPVDLREVLLMRERAELSFKQIAEAVGIPENTAKSRMRYALERLRAELGEDDDVRKAAQ